MGERTLFRTHPLADRIPALDAAETEGLRIEAEAGVAAVDLRVDPTGPGVDAAARALGPRLPTQPNTWKRTHDGQAVWLGPDESCGPPSPATWPTGCSTPPSSSVPTRPPPRLPPPSPDAPPSRSPTTAT
ncbi:hypothetical protein [Pseudonocardia sp. NPDC049154]|uniref:hypothetical protein n=1 Tax=Pseudonocardia sp. NPDC049154 TaxID=3155501 RepID=UPI0033C4D55A